jgi:hypothetical protein
VLSPVLDLCTISGMSYIYVYIHVYICVYVFNTQTACTQSRHLSGLSWCTTGWDSDVTCTRLMYVYILCIHILGGLRMNTDETTELTVRGTGEF